MGQIRYLGDQLTRRGGPGRKDKAEAKATTICSAAVKGTAGQPAFPVTSKRCNMANAALAVLEVVVKLSSGNAKLANARWGAFLMNFLADVTIVVLSVLFAAAAVAVYVRYLLDVSPSVSSANNTIASRANTQRTWEIVIALTCIAVLVFVSALATWALLF